MTGTTKSRRWKEHESPAERIADRRLERVLNLQRSKPRRIVLWCPDERRMLLGTASLSRTDGSRRWRRVLRIKRLIRRMDGKA